MTRTPLAVCLDGRSNPYQRDQCLDRTRGFGYRAFGRPLRCPCSDQSCCPVSQSAEVDRGIRELIASFCGQIASSTQVRERVFRDGRVSIPAESEMLHHFERLIFTATKIRLMINPLDDEHRKLIEAIDALLQRFRTAPDTEDLQVVAQAMARQIIAMGLAIIRHEWLRVQKGD